MELTEIVTRSQTYTQVLLAKQKWPVFELIKDFYPQSLLINHLKEFFKKIEDPIA